MSSITRRLGAGILAAGATFAVLVPATSAHAADLRVHAHPGATSASSTSWFVDPLTAAQRADLVAVPRDPSRHDGGSRHWTRARYRTAGGALAVPVTRARGHQLVNGQAVTLTAPFAAGSARLSGVALRQVRVLRASTRLVGALTCEGYTDYGRTRPTPGTPLSRARASAVCRALKDGRPSVRTGVVGLGATRPVLVGPHGRRGHDPRVANRRVVVVVTANAPHPVVVPGAPSLDAVGFLDGRAVVTFDAPVQAGTSAVTGYEYTVDGGTTWQTLTGVTGSDPYTATVTGLTNGTSYRVAVRAVSRAGNGTPSTTVDGSPAAAAVAASAPTIVWAHFDFSYAHFGFTPPADDGGSPVTGYEMSLDGGPWLSFEDSSGSGYVDTGITDCSGSQHSIAVRAQTAAGAGAPSEPVDAMCMF